MRRRSPWWRHGVLYQIYPRSFRDAGGDGIGDLRGITEKLDYLAWLGVDGIWLNPTMPSPNDDWGYDVSDYCAVHAELGTLDDLDALVAEARKREIAVLLDLVPNHTSDRHPWFLDSLSGRTARHGDWYVWADGKEDGSPPNNWLSVFGGPAWTREERRGQYFLHNFLPSQPDLNWWNDEVRAAFDDILRFWLDRGIAGFRIDVAHGIVKDRELRDNPPATEEDPPRIREYGQRPAYNMNRPEVHDVLRRWRSLADAYEPDRVLLGETWAPDLAGLATFYGSSGDELHLAFNFFFVLSRFDAAELRGIVDATVEALPRDAAPAWTLSNHDLVRVATRWCDEDDAKLRCALLALLTLPGTPVLYYGDEIGLAQTSVAPDRARDRPGGRDGSRTPMHWSAEPGAGFTDPPVEPWLPLGDHQARNVAGQRDDPSSVLSFCRAAIALRRKRSDLQDGVYAALPSPEEVWAWRRGEDTLVALNLGSEPAKLPGIDGEIAIATRRARDGETVRGRLPLGAWEGALVVGAPRT